ncbi:MAG: hypothetical protein HYS12_17040 [Planctomycetes bacterium]|nr:hypothetical protein [Planctomycetota bacterium]
MTLPELMQSLTSADLYPIPVEGDIERPSVRGLAFLGDLDAFIQSAKALSVRCVFIATRVLQESDFLYEEGHPRVSYVAARRRALHADAGLSVDLRGVEPSLNEFKAYVGRECGFRLAVHLPNTTLEYVLHQPWWQRFSELRQRVIEKVLQERELAESKEVEEEERRSQEVLNALRELINDPEFVGLPTQRAMQAYAFERIAGLNSINPNTLKIEIQSLDAKIKAKGLGRKK